MLRGDQTGSNVAFFFIACAGGLSLALDVPSIVSLGLQPKAAVGKVISTEPMNHGSAKVAYEVDGVGFERALLVGAGPAKTRPFFISRTTRDFRRLKIL
jgi:hypothetical protein